STADDNEPRDGLPLGVVGDLDEEIELALAASGIRVHRWQPGTRGDDEIVWAAGVPFEAVAALAAAGKAVVTDVSAGDATALPRLVHAGVADAVVRPHGADAIVRRIWRVHRLRVASR